MNIKKIIAAIKCIADILEDVFEELGIELEEDDVSDDDMDVDSEEEEKPSSVKAEAGRRSSDASTTR